MSTHHSKPDDEDRADDGDDPEHDPAEGKRHPGRDTDHRFPHPLLFLVPVIVISLLALAIHRIEPDAPGAFYTPPSPLPAGQHGNLIQGTGHEPQAVSGAPSGSQGWLFMYQTTDINDQPVAATAVVFAPTSPAPEGGRPVIAWAHPTTGVASRCAPSLQPGGGASRIPGLQGFLDAGYVVVATDYPGLGTPGPHPYLVGVSEGNAVLDSVLAIRQIPAVGASTTFGLWGHSQGGQAALFAAALAPTYAPELDLVGIAAAAPATDLATLLQKDLGGVTGNVLGAMAVTSWSQIYADEGAQLGQILTPEAIPMAKLIADYCIESTAQMVVDLPEAEILNVSFLSNDPWSTEPWEQLLAQNTPGVTTTPPIQVPILINQGTADTVVWPSVTSGWIQSQCAAGQSITEALYTDVTHTYIGFNSAANTQDWLTARFAGDQAATGCSSATATFTPVAPLS